MRFVGFAFSLFAFVVACGDDIKSKTDAGIDGKVVDARPDASPDAPDGTTVLRSTLSGYQEVPPVHGTARGAAALGIDEARTQITVDLSYTDLTGITAAHIHVGQPGTAPTANVIFTLASADFTSPLTKTLTAADFTAGGGITTFADAVQAILDGETYINVHTTDNPAGAIRGHVGKVTLSAVASGLQENPRVSTMASGVTTITIDEEQTTIGVNLDTEMIMNPTVAHIHVGEVGKNGPPIFDLPTPADPLVATLDESMLKADAANGINNMRDAVDAILSGRAYVNLHTATNPGGEIRAQLGAVSLRSSLTPGQETMAVASTAKGRGFVTISGDQTTITTSTTYEGIVQANITAAHIHSGAFGVNGGPMFTLAGANAPSPINNVLTSADFTVTPQVATFTAAINALIVGDTYINVHSMAFPNGEIRGQLGRVVLTSAMNGLKERPTPNTSLATATATVTIPGSQRSVVVAGLYNGLTNITAAHIHLGGSNVAGPALFGLANAMFASPFSFEVDSTALMMQTGAMNMFEAIGQIFDGNTYINIHTTAFPDGEVRGQITP